MKRADFMVMRRLTETQGGIRSKARLFPGHVEGVLTVYDAHAMGHPIRTAILCLLPMLAASCCIDNPLLLGTQVFLVQVRADGVPVRAPAKLPTGKPLNVCLRFDADQYDNYGVTQQVALLRGGTEVGAATCTVNGMNQKRRRSSVVGAMNCHGCNILVPDEGADEVQVSFRATPSDAVRFSKVEVALYQKD